MPGVTIGSGHGGQIDAERMGQGTVGRQLLAAAQATTGDVALDRIRNLPVERAGRLGNCRDPFHAISRIRGL